MLYKDRLRKSLIVREKWVDQQNLELRDGRGCIFWFLFLFYILYGIKEGNLKMLDSVGNKSCSKNLYFLVKKKK